MMTTKVAQRPENDDLDLVMTNLGREAKAAAAVLAKTGTEAKNKALIAAAAAIRARAQDILAANARDMDAAKSRGLAPAMLDRLLLNADRIEGMAKGLDAIAGLPDPVGKVTERWTRPNGLDISRVRVPLGVIGIIYESRPTPAWWRG
jgi:glutamate-5-semialdehyde dehydrogenase